MHLKFKKEKTSHLRIANAVSVSVEMKQDLDFIKKSGVDVNTMTRDYWQMLIDKAKTSAKCS